MEKRKCLCVILWKAEAGQAESQVLLLKVRPERGSFWQPVTGHVEEGEDFVEAALREAQEESGFAFERQPQYLGLDYRFEGRFGRAHEKAYALWVISPERPTPKLDANEHVDYAWVSPEEALQRVRFPSNKDAISRASRPLPPLLLTKSGLWFQEGQEITHGRTVELLHHSLAATSTGFLVRIAGEEAEVILEDSPRFVQSYDAESGRLSLVGGLQETVRPESLQIGLDDGLYCVLENGWKAKFLSPAYYSIAKEIREEPHSGGAQYFLHFQGRDYEISIPGQSKRMDA